MNILYLHGLESKPGGEKVSWLSSVASVYAPAMDYTDEDCLQKVMFHHMITSGQIDLIIGSSMGGYIADLIHKKFDIPAILFNPALHSRSIEPAVPFAEYFVDEGDTASEVMVILGRDDKVIDPNKTIELLEESKGNYHYMFFEAMAHQTPLHIFMSIVRMYADQLTYKKLY